MKRFFTLFLILCLVLTLGGCGSSSSYPAAYGDGYYGEDTFNLLVSSSASAEAAPATEYQEAARSSWEEYDLSDMAEEDYAIEPEVALDNVVTGGGEAGAVTVNEASASQRKIIRTVDLRMESTEYDACAASVDRAIAEFGGYTEYSDIRGNIDPGALAAGASYSGDSFGVARLSATQPSYHSGDRYLFLRVRVPEESLDAFLNRVEGLGNVLSKQESAEDITLQYVDVQSRIAALKAEQDSLLALLEQATSVEDMILLQDRLSYVRYQIESYESQLRVMSNQISYSTVNLTLEEVVVYTPKEEFNPTIGQRISTGFGRTMADIKSFWINLLVWAAVNSVYIICWLAVFLAAFILLRRMRKKMPRVEKKPLPSREAPEEASQTTTETGEAPKKKTDC